MPVHPNKTDLSSLGLPGSQEGLGCDTFLAQMPAGCEFRIRTTKWVAPLVMILLLWLLRSKAMGNTLVPPLISDKAFAATVFLKASTNVMMETGSEMNIVEGRDGNISMHNRNHRFKFFRQTIDVSNLGLLGMQETQCDTESATQTKDELGTISFRTPRKPCSMAGVASALNKKFLAAENIYKIRLRWTMVFDTTMVEDIESIESMDGSWAGVDSA
ncbi:hypothetical protein B0H19DRAFT_1079937 [Mycena capillaripes]|nr:hypothetical protein B0H19DRAFT_1079937 [Mycena capillaripes]